jgi:hypothetical protein
LPDDREGRPVGERRARVDRRGDFEACGVADILGAHEHCGGRADRAQLRAEPFTFRNHTILRALYLKPRRTYRTVAKWSNQSS